MGSQAVAIRATGLVTSVGLSAPATCAAIRAGVTNPVETRFADRGGEWIMAHEVPLQRAWRGLDKLAMMAVTAIDEALAGVPPTEWRSIPMILCIAEDGRPGRSAALDDRLFLMIEAALQARFAESSLVVARGRVSVAHALDLSRRLLAQPAHDRVLIVATDSQLSWPTLRHYLADDRLLTGANSNGFMPGEAAGALLVSLPDGQPRLTCRGVGFGDEGAWLGSGQPLRADGLVTAINAALSDAGCQMHDLGFRVSDLSGEQFFFKEAALALGRTLKQRRAEYDLWHPAECVGETGAAIGAIVLAVAEASCRKGYAASPDLLAHFANDTAPRAACVLGFGHGRSEGSQRQVDRG